MRDVVQGQDRPFYCGGAFDVMNFSKVCLAAGAAAAAVWYVRTHYYFGLVEDEEEWWVIPSAATRSDPIEIYGADEALRRWA